MAEDEAKIVSVQRYVAQMLERLSKQYQDNVEAQTQVPMFTEIFFERTPDNKIWRITSTTTGQFQHISIGARFKYCASVTTARDLLKPTYSTLLVTRKDELSITVSHFRSIIELHERPGPWCLIEWVEDGDVSVLKTAVEDFGTNGSALWQSLISGSTSTQSSFRTLPSTAQMPWEELRAFCKQHHLNEGQTQAVQQVLSQRIGLLHGPPGTGKTRTLQCAIAMLAHRHERVVIAGPSHQATDLLMQSASANDAMPRTKSIARIATQSKSQLGCNITTWNDK